tara:strand:- start:144 stop:416 length:273 start_codon:yes stop_codon:yes gene_type:complete
MVMCIVLDRSGDGPEPKTSKGHEMSDLLTALHLEIVIVDLRIKMLEAIESGYYDLAMTMQLLILVRTDELDAHKLMMSPGAWAIYETMHP